MAQVQIITQLQSRYSIFDASGRLPFSIVFGLYRHSKTDADSRDLSFRTAGSFLDVPYALKHRLLTLSVKDGLPGKRNDVDFSGLVLSTYAEQSSTGFILPSLARIPGGTNEDRIQRFQYDIEANSPLASYLEPGKSYRLRLTSKNLGIAQWLYRNEDNERLSKSEPTSRATETAKLVSHTVKRAVTDFRFENLVCHPPIDIRMRLCPDPDSGGELAVEASFTNTGPEAISVQARGYQRFLVAFGPDQQPESDLQNGRSRILDPDHQHQETPDLRVFEAATGEVVRGATVLRRGGCAGLRSGSIDVRPRVKDLVALQPMVPVTRVIRFGKLLEGLPEGVYRIQLWPRGCWWHVGTFAGEDDPDQRVPKASSSRDIPPLVLESEAGVVVCLQSGIASESFWVFV